MKQLVTKYTFNATAKTVTFGDFEQISLERLLLVTNATRNVILYNFADATRNGTVSGNVLTLGAATTGMLNSDKLSIFYDVARDDPQSDKTIISNSRSRFRDGFKDNITQPDATVWDMVNDDVTAQGHIVNEGGNSSGAGYLRISLSPFLDGSGVTITSKRNFHFPFRIGFGVSISQRIVGQEAFVGFVGATADGTAVDYGSTIADQALTGTATTTSTTTQFTVPNHGFTGGDRVLIYGCADRRLNVSPVLVTVVDANTFTVPMALGAGTASITGGFVRVCEPMRYAKNGAGLLFDNATAQQANFVSRRDGAKTRILLSTTATTTATQTSTSPYSDAFNATAVQELYASFEEVSYRSFSADSNAAMSGGGKWSQGIPSDDPDYKLCIRARTLSGFTCPIARIVTVSKTGTATATVTTDVPHNLAVGDLVQAYGVRDASAANFVGLTSGVAVASVPTSTTFTVLWGSAVTVTSTGGVVWLNQGGVLAPGVIPTSINSVARTANVLTVSCYNTIAGLLPGEYVQLHGMEGTAAQYEGAYKVLRIGPASNLLEVESVGANFGTVSTGGVMIKRTDVRIHFVRSLDYTRVVTEVVGGRGNTLDANNAVPVAITPSGVVSVAQSTGVNTVQWNAAGYSGLVVSDVVSAAITTSATTAAIIPGTVSTVGTYSHSFYLGVTAIATVTLDVGIEESADNGTTWVRIYDFERISAVGAYYSPQIRSVYGSRYRYVQTVSGTGSVTRGINRLMYSTPGQMIRRFIDRTIVVNTQFSKTPVYLVEGCDLCQFVISLGPVTTTAPQFLLQGSETNGAQDWYSIGGVFSGFASSAVMQTTTGPLPKFVRLMVSTAGAGATLDYVAIKAIGR